MGNVSKSLHKNVATSSDCTVKFLFLSYKLSWVSVLFFMKETNKLIKLDTWPPIMSTGHFSPLMLQNLSEIYEACKLKMGVANLQSGLILLGSNNFTPRIAFLFEFIVVNFSYSNRVNYKRKILFNIINFKIIVRLHFNCWITQIFWLLFT